ncbi:hypothetical protein UFOVP633_19 [uncultured Caudovirales phage]|uniref:Uncharacterized protein n=1 Tax=uncultured Caudovirales phage TaxID=2100421 RepID=A0A6J5N9P4_9CAUD|nr:hypothetical protein UFOVP633_19 [uncultured Caudovirales phage]
MGKKISQLTAISGGVFADADIFEISVSSGGAFVSRKITGAEMKATIPSGITINTTTVTSGTSGRVLFENTGVVKESANFFWDNTNSRLSIGQGASPGAVVDIRAAGALFTDLALRVRNSLDNANLFSVQGDGVANVLSRINLGFSGMTTTGGALHVYAGNSADFISRWYNTAGAGIVSIRTVSNGGQLTISSSSGVAGLTLDGQNSNSLTFGAGRDIWFDSTTGTKIGAATTQKFAFWNKTPIVQPTTAIASATVLSPGGGINIKTDDTFDGYTIAQVVKALRNIGILA